MIASSKNLICFTVVHRHPNADSSPMSLEITPKHPRNMNDDGTGTIDVVITNTSEVSGKKCLGNPAKAWVNFCRTL